MDVTPAAEPAAALAPRPAPHWRLIGIFYGVCFGIVSLVALGLSLFGADLSATGAQLAFQLTVAFIYMPAPLISALIAERIAHRTPLIRTTFVGFGRKLPRLLLTFTVLTIAVYATYVLFGYLFGNLIRVPGAGVMASSQAELTRNLTTLFTDVAAGRGLDAPSPSELSVPPVWLLHLLSVVGGLLAGVSINGLFAFGEEYGWRGFLMEELRPLGAMRANLVTGVLWGLFHAPIILLGFNYAPYRLLGIPAMVVLCTSLSFLYWRAREYTGSLLAPALLHGSFNASAGMFLLLLADRNPLISLPTGLLGAAAIAVVAGAFWRWSDGMTA